MKRLTAVSPSYFGCVTESLANRRGVSQSDRVPCIAVTVVLTRGVVGGVGCGVGLGVGFTTTNLGGSESRPGVESAAGPAVNNCDGD